jgi:hypothetical protein
MLATEEGATMSTRSNVVRLAIFGLLVARAPRWLQRVLAWMALGAVLAFVLIFLSVAAHSSEVGNYECYNGKTIPPNNNETLSIGRTFRLFIKSANLLAFALSTTRSAARSLRGPTNTAT